MISRFSRPFAGVIALAGLLACGGSPTAHPIVGVWVVKHQGAPFPYHRYVCNADGTMQQANPDAGNPRTSDSDGKGIWIGAAEATAIAYAQQGVVPPRPLTHDLLKDTLEALGHALVRVRIDELRDKVFYATLVVDGTAISARPSDGIALALRTASPILVHEDVFTAAGITMAPEEDDEVERFREFLDQVSPEDFEAPDGPGGLGGSEGERPPSPEQ